VERLVRHLGSDAFTRREAASKALDQAGEVALPALHQALDSPDPEVQRRAGELVVRIEARRQRRWREQLAAAVTAVGGRFEVSDGADSVRQECVTLPASAGDADFIRLARLPGAAAVTVLRVAGSRLTDAGLAHMDAFRALHSLDLSNTAVTGAGLTYLRGLRLRTLSLERTRLQGADMAHLRAMASLQTLSLAFTRIGDDGMAHLAVLHQLVDLDLRKTAVTDRGVMKLSGLTEVCLWLQGSKVSGAVANEHRSTGYVPRETIIP
jgi:hypothetical protein